MSLFPENDGTALSILRSPSAAATVTEVRVCVTRENPFSPEMLRTIPLPSSVATSPVASNAFNCGPGKAAQPQANASGGVTSHSSSVTSSYHLLRSVYHGGGTRLVGSPAAGGGAASRVVVVAAEAAAPGSRTPMPAPPPPLGKMSPAAVYTSPFAQQQRGGPLPPNNNNNAAAAAPPLFPLGDVPSTTKRVTGSNDSSPHVVNALHGASGSSGGYMVSVAARLAAFHAQVVASATEQQQQDAIAAHCNNSSRKRPRAANNNNNNNKRASEGGAHDDGAPRGNVEGDGDDEGEEVARWRHPPGRLVGMDDTAKKAPTVPAEVAVTTSPPPLAGGGRVTAAPAATALRFGRTLFSMPSAPAAAVSPAPGATRDYSTTADAGITSAQQLLQRLQQRCSATAATRPPELQHGHQAAPPEAMGGGGCVVGSAASPSPLPPLAAAAAGSPPSLAAQRLADHRSLLSAITAEAVEPDRIQAPALAVAVALSERCTGGGGGGFLAPPSTTPERVAAALKVAARAGTAGSGGGVVTSYSLASRHQGRFLLDGADPTDADTRVRDVVVGWKGTIYLLGGNDGLDFLLGLLSLARKKHPVDIVTFNASALLIPLLCRARHQARVEEIARRRNATSSRAASGQWEAAEGSCVGTDVCSQQAILAEAQAEGGCPAAVVSPLPTAAAAAGLPRSGTLLGGSFCIHDLRVMGWMVTPDDPCVDYDVLHRTYRPGQKAASHQMDVPRGMYERVWTMIPLFRALYGVLGAKGLLPAYLRTERDVAVVCCSMKLDGFVVNTAALDMYLADSQRDMATLRQQAARYSPNNPAFNIQSPDDCRALLYDDLHLERYLDGAGEGSYETKKGGKLTTSEEALKQLVPFHPLPGIILQYRKLAKLSQTYVDGVFRCATPINATAAADWGLDASTIERSSSSSLQLIHCNFIQESTDTGRLSCIEPNLQNLPRCASDALGSVRKAFVAPPGHTLLSVDYQQIELRVLAHLSQDQILLETLGQQCGHLGDIHRQIAAVVFHKVPAAVTPDERTQAKRVVFGVLYGMGPRALALSIGSTLDFAAKVARQFRGSFPHVARYQAKVLDDCRQFGFVRTLFGRIRPLPDIAEPNNGVKRALAERQAFNTVIQGSAADIMKRAMWQVYLLCCDSKWFCNVPPSEGTSTADCIRRPRLIGQVHDELLLAVPDEFLPRVAVEVARCMSSVAQLLVPLVVTMRAGPSLGDLQPLDANGQYDETGISTVHAATNADKLVDPEGSGGRAGLTEGDNVALLQELDDMTDE